MSEKEHLQWLNCAFDALKDGEDQHLKTYEEWLESTQTISLFKKRRKKLLL